MAEAGLGSLVAVAGKTTYDVVSKEIDTRTTPEDFVSLCEPAVEAIVDLKRTVEVITDFDKVNCSDLLLTAILYRESIMVSELILRAEGPLCRKYYHQGNTDYLFWSNKKPGSRVVPNGTTLKRAVKRVLKKGKGGEEQVFYETEVEFTLKLEQLRHKALSSQLVLKQYIEKCLENIEVNMELYYVRSASDMRESAGEADLKDIRKLDAKLSHVREGKTVVNLNNLIEELRKVRVLEEDQR